MALAMAFVCAAASAKVMANPSVRKPVAQFIYFYEQTEDLSLWERVVYSVLMTKSATEPSS